MEEPSGYIEQGPYLGDISALCFLHRSTKSLVPFLVAGTGAQLLLYDIEDGKVLLSSNVFDGVRIHGIHSSCCLFRDTDDVCCGGSDAVRIAVYGERRVKLFLMRLSQSPPPKQIFEGHACLDLLQTIPKFNYWVMDVRFLKAINRQLDENNSCNKFKDFVDFLAIGLGDNSVAVWDLCHSCLLYEIKCTERCLLYSLSLWGNSFETLRVASGTIFNEILIWKVILNSKLHIGLDSQHSNGTEVALVNQKIQEECCYSILLKRLTGHEGSIFRITWSQDGLKFISASDDRSARIWTCTPDQNAIKDSCTTSSFEVVAGPVLFGHSARIWDCYISDTIVITASEDCSCRIWDSHGKPISTIYGHIGRGVWRCKYENVSSMLITGGSDSSIKVRHLGENIKRQLLHNSSKDNFVDSNREIFKISIGQAMPVADHEFTNSKSEYVRCLKLARENCLYVATNHGYLYHIDLILPGNERWTPLFQVKGQQPIVCIDTLVMNPVGLNNYQDFLAFGDGKGQASVLHVNFQDSKPNITDCFLWNAERERQLLGIYWCKSLGHSHLFTADPKGGIKLWKLGHLDRSCKSCEVLECTSPRGTETILAAEFKSNLLARIVCVDVSYTDELLFCGDQQGNIVVFQFPMTLLARDNSEMMKSFQKLCTFKGAHGISSVSSVSVRMSDHGHIHICTTGKDGCICKLIYDKNVEHESLRLTFSGVKNVPEISMIESVVDVCSKNDMFSSKYAAGFAASDFLLWDITNETEILRVSCGGWRRPHAYILGSVPDNQSCFAYIKEHYIHVVRNWVPDNLIRKLPQVLHTQFHGREIHSIRLIPFPDNLPLARNGQCYLDVSWIATGSEDGTVRLTRYSPHQIGKLNPSLLLEEHVGGSAVRSVIIVSKIHSLHPVSDSCRKKHDATCSSKDAPLLLFAAGSKQILTCWLLKWTNAINDFVFKGISKEEYKDGNCMISSQWLTTYRQPRENKISKKCAKEKHQCHMKGIKPENRMPEFDKSEKEGDDTQRLKGVSFPMNEEQDDWRYLAMTAFLVQVSERSKICFIVTSCSNSSLSVQVLLFPSLLWYEVALLEHEQAPVLTLQHIVAPIQCPCSDNAHNMYLLFSGTTTGNIAVWNLTGLVNEVAEKVSVLDPGKSTIALRRPKTGRGSQGGRRWRLSRHKNEFFDAISPKSEVTYLCHSKKSISKYRDVSGEDKAEYNPVERPKLDPFTVERPKLDPFRETEDKFDGFDVLEANTNAEAHEETPATGKMYEEIHRLRPFHVFYSAHQSGVNCLHISRLYEKSPEKERCHLCYCIVSGGDDQALHTAIFGLNASHADDEQSTDIHSASEQTEPDDKIGVGKSTFRFVCLNQHVIRSAHSSSVKGVWTDGNWVFSVGLDQRLRCWSVVMSNDKCSLEEHCCSIISVPEPEALHATLSHRRNCYRIVVAGRGMQGVDFVA